MTLVIGIFVSVSAFAQDILVKGHVKDDLGEDVIGASVRLKDNTTVGTVTDINGNFNLKAKKGATLVVSFIGYATQEVKAAENLRITLVEDAKLLNESVVIGYGTVKKTDLTGAVSTLKPDEKNHGLVTNAQEMLQGKIAGVTVTSDGGTPGGGATIRVRGGSSLNASNNPLYVIDGLAIDEQGMKGVANPLSMINPADIESFTVLKDASSTAIYGSRGNNGVIIITTKKGSKSSKPQIAYNGNVSVSAKQNLLDVMDASEYRNFIRSYYGENSEAYSLLGKANTNWQDEIYRTAVSTDHNLTISGAAKNMPYRVSLGYTDQNGILDGSNFQRYTGSFSLNPTFLDQHLNINANGRWMNAKNTYANTDAVGAANFYDPTQSVYEANADIFGGYTTWKNEGSALNDPYWTETQNRNATKNPVALLNEKSDKANTNDFMGNIDVDYKIHGLEDIRLHLGLQGDYAKGEQNTLYTPYGPSNHYYGNVGSTTESKYNATLNAYAQYTKDFNEIHHLDVMGGYEWNHKKYWGDSYYAGVYPETNNDESLRGTPYNESASEWKQESYLVSFFGRLNYSAFGRYLLTATVRRDGSSRFKNHWGTFPSFSVAWKINEEAFLRDVDIIDELKLRGGWGKTGQQDGIGNYRYFASYNVNSNNVDGRYPITGINDSGLLYRPDAYNPNISWEKLSNWNVGIDASFFNNRLLFNADVYYRKTVDLINDASVPAGSNFRNQVISNIGSLENKGIEASVTGRPIATKDWQWEITANVAYNKNKILELNGEGSLIPTKGISAGTGQHVGAYATGEDASAFYVFQQVYDEAGKPVEGVYVDRNGDGTISESDRYFYKQSMAPVTLGLSSRLQYKNWDFGFSLRANIDNYVYNDNLAGFSNIAKTYDSSFAYTHNTLPAAVSNGWTTYDNARSDYFVQNASFIKCDNITLGYSFSNLFKGANYNGLRGRISASVTNAFTITKYDGVDPEVFGGVDNNLYPRPITCTLGLSLNF